MDADRVARQGKTTVCRKRVKVEGNFGYISAGTRPPAGR